MIGKTYLERGQPVVVLARWGSVAWRCPPRPICFLTGGIKDAPRNVLIQRAGGEQIVRPFRGLRKVPAAPQSQDTQGGET